MAEVQTRAVVVRSITPFYEVMAVKLGWAKGRESKIGAKGESTIKIPCTRWIYQILI